MPAEIIEGIMPVIAMLGMGTFVLIGMKLRFDHKAKMLDKTKGSDDLERLTEAMDSMYEQARALRDDIGELQERLDFHERLLTKPKEE